MGSEMCIRDRGSSSQARLSAQTAMQHILESLVRSLMPILSFTAEEIWGHMAGEREASVLYTTTYQPLTELPDDLQSDSDWQTVIAVRDEVAKQIEAIRGEGKIGSALDANVELFADGDIYQKISSLGDELRFVLITSAASIAPLDQASSSAVDTDIAELKIVVSPLSDEKCVRCWHRRPDLGSIAEHPELCVRCVENIDGDGEQRLHA